jgi:hypothetical protein
MVSGPSRSYGQGRLKLPRYPGLLSQLAALEFETGARHDTHSVPERAGHDDLAMSLCLAVHSEPGLLGPRRGRIVV